MSEHLVSVDDVRAFHRHVRPGFAEALAESRGKTEIAAVLSAIDRREELLGLVERYRALKRHLGLMEFSDQIELSARLADLRPDVGQGERARFAVVLLDEYQDTSVAQALMLKRLFSGDDRATGRGHPVTAVGDPNQAIYGWRGASVSNILRFGRDFPAAAESIEMAPYSLTVNRRSDRRILDVANELAKPLSTHDAPGQQLQATDETPEGAVRAEVFETYDEELAWLADDVVAARHRCGSWQSIGVLARDNAHAADVFKVRSEANVPVEIVGLKGLLALPEVAEVVATLTLLQELTANAAMLTLLTGPRWAIGPRDLALLGSRAEELSGGAHRRGDGERPLAEQLQEVVAGADPTDVVSLSDALDDPGDAGYSAEARERFALLSAELRSLRSHAGEPLLDLVRRIVDTTGIDIELASSIDPAAAARRDNLDLFLRAVAEFQAIDGAVTLSALLAFLEAEDETGGNGLDVATPTEGDSVKLLTVHRAKGLEWDVVYLVGVAREKFPTNRTRTKWTAGPAVLPYPLRGDADDLPVLRGCTKADLQEFSQDCKQHEALEERRLGYVAFTRARHELVVSSYCWTVTRRTPTGPSSYQEVVKDYLERRGESVPRWREAPVRGTDNPLQADRMVRSWPVPSTGDEITRRLAAAGVVRAEMERQAAGAGMAADLGLDDQESRLVATWDDELERLVAEAAALRADAVAVPLPTSVSATTLADLRDKPGDLAAALARPMPRRPSAAAYFGTRFHAWVEGHFRGGQEFLVDPDDLAGRGDDGIEDDADLKDLIATFESGPFASRSDVEVEVPFALVLAGQVVRGRIDAVFREADGTFLVVDWKTNRSQTADPLQLAVYRVAWAELRGVPLSSVRAAFYYVRDGAVVSHDRLPSRAELEALLTPVGAS